MPPVHVRDAGSGTTHDPLPLLHIHRAERADALIEALGRLLAEPLADPFAPDVIAVPTRGMERWLTQRMSASLGATPGRADGICANVEFPFPRRLAGDAVAAASGIDPEARSVAPAARRVAAARRRRRMPGGAVAAQPRATTSARRTTPTAARAASRPSATSPSCSTATRCTARRWSAAGRAAMPPACPTRPRGRRSCGGGCARGSAPRARPSGSSPRASVCARSPRSSTSPSASRCSA